MDKIENIKYYVVHPCVCVCVWPLLWSDFWSACLSGEVVDFDAYTDINIPAGILKKFFRELEEPLMTYDLFEPITRLHCE